MQRNGRSRADAGISPRGAAPRARPAGETERSECRVGERQAKISRKRTVTNPHIGLNPLRAVPAPLRGFNLEPPSRRSSALGRETWTDGLRIEAALRGLPDGAHGVAPPITAPLRYGMWPSQLLMDAFGSPLPLFFLVTMLVTVSRYRLRWQRELEFGSSGCNGESPGDHTHTVSATPLLLCHTHYTQASRPAAFGNTNSVVVFFTHTHTQRYKIEFPLKSDLASGTAPQLILAPIADCNVTLFAGADALKFRQTTHAVAHGNDTGFRAFIRFISTTCIANCCILHILACSTSPP